MERPRKISIMIKFLKDIFTKSGYDMDDVPCSRQRGKYMYVNGKKVELPENDPGGEHE